MNFKLICLFLLFFGSLLYYYYYYYYYYYSLKTAEHLSIYKPLNSYKIRVKTMGGLGNQIFQVVFIYSFSKYKNIDYNIFYSFESQHNTQNFQYYNTIFKDFISNDKDTTKYTEYLEPVNNFSIFMPEIYDIKENTEFIGYFQNEKYFIKYKDDIIHNLTNNDIYKKIDVNDAYFIHIRRGDYLSISIYHINLDIYYENAIKYILRHDKDAIFYIISDDIEFCKTYNVLNNINKFFYSNTNDLETLYFMSKCKKGGICPNSTFSWWGSYLNTNKKIVIFPDKWLNTDYLIDIYYKDSLIFSTTQLYLKKPVTIVSGYWAIKNKHNNKYLEWFNNTLKINCPYIFFGNFDSIQIVKKFRKDLPTFYINMELESFYNYKFYDVIQTDTYHCPTKELNIIWNEKIFLMNIAKNLNIFDSDYFIWCDAGICNYRNNSPPTEEFPKLEKILSIPHDKFIYTSCDEDSNKVSGTFMIYKDFIPIFLDIFKTYLDNYDKNKNYYTDQIILTNIKNDYPDIFYKISDGYGKLIEVLY